MSYQEFLEELQFELNIRSNNNYKFELSKAMKTNNHEMDTFIVRYKENPLLTPQIYPLNYYRQYESYGRDVHDIADEFLDIARKERNNLENIKEVISELKSENAKEHLTLRLYNKEWNSEIVSTCSFQDMGCGLVAVPRWEIECLQDGMEASILVTKDLQRRLLMTDEEVLNIAYENAMQQEYTFKPMSQVIEELTGHNVSEDMGDERMYVLSNQKQSFGAIAIMNRDVLRDVKERLGENEFFVLPSSMHECIILPSSQVDSVENLKEIVAEVNETQVDLEERLGEDVLRFNGKKLQICNTTEELMKQRREELAETQTMAHEAKHEKTQRRAA